MSRPGRAPTARHPRATLLAALLTTALAACSPAAAGPPPATDRAVPPSTESPAPDLPPLDARSTAADLQARLTPLSGTATLPLGSAVTVEDLGGSTRTTITGDVPDGVLALVAAPAGGTIEVLEDGSAVVRDAAGTVVAGLAAPTPAPSPDGVVEPASDAVRLEQAAPDLVRVVGPPRGGAQLWASDSPVVTTTWTEQEGGRSLAVAPSDWSRVAGQAAADLVWAHLALVGEEATSSSMHDQLLCHMIGAPDKETWNLEPWRPDVGFIGVLAAACNPV
ncbi:DUF2599 domain-containing protein [Actinotalea solisilvae]|uniref:DUF2599 domain-containing protein n=1 Tax=Actinotalea solisilvae TaxID=2072922 RepID=UPI0018F17248|nr:DUF2599 domain-containing protein [Actinotalea solisilvae]